MQNDGSAIVRQLRNGVAYNNRGLYVLGYSLTRSSLGYALLCTGETEVWAHVLVVWPSSCVFPLKRFSIFRLKETALCYAGRIRAILCRKDAACYLSL